MSIIRREKIAKPRILLLDFDSKVAEAISSRGYFTIMGNSGLSGKVTNIPQHQSEVDLIFWDCSKLKVTSTIYVDPDSDAISMIRPYFEYIRKKKGITTILLSKDEIVPKHISRATGYTFGLLPRKTTNIIPPTYAEEGIEHLRPLLERFVVDENIKFSIHWADNQVGYTDFYADEDDNKFVAFNDPDLLVFPFVNNQTDFILCALQDCFPYLTSEEIFPDIHNTPWLNSEDFIYPEIKDLESKIQTIRQKAQTEIAKVEKRIATTHDKTAFLNKALIADDSDAFSDENRLKPQVAKMLGKLGFNVKDLDEENIKLGLALKEDLQITDKQFFALVEVKGAEKGARASWVRVDLNAHITEFSRLNKISADKLSSLLVFNHDRRIAPTDRSQPFSGDPNLVAYCMASSITLVPIYELYKLCLSVMTGNTKAEAARNDLKNPGLYSFTEK